MKLHELEDDAPRIFTLMQMALNRGKVIRFGHNKKVIKIVLQQIGTGSATLQLAKLEPKKPLSRNPTMVYTIPFTSANDWTLVREGDNFALKFDPVPKGQESLAEEHEESLGKPIIITTLERILKDGRYPVVTRLGKMVWQLRSIEHQPESFLGESWVLHMQRILQGAFYGQTWLEKRIYLNDADSVTIEKRTNPETGKLEFELIDRRIR